MNKLLQKDGVRSTVASILSILAGMLVGSVIILLTALFTDQMSRPHNKHGRLFSHKGWYFFHPGFVSSSD